MWRNIMAFYVGKEWKRSDLLSLIGDPHQIAGARPFVYMDGKAEGVRGISVNTGGGLQFTVLPGRGMDRMSTALPLILKLWRGWNRSRN
jgi:hypothetical protein